MTTRREFLQTAAVLLGGVQAARRLPLGFSTLGCPTWDLQRVLEFASTHGYASIELRGLQDTMDLTRHPDLAPARLLRLRDRGRIAPGAAADLVAFDPATVADRATFENPFQYPAGIPHVIVNGVVALRGGERTGVGAGKGLRPGIV